ncbi:MAG TPA: ATP-binding protein [Ktedonobacterales bacterium]|nr:ATP-binding protein [Ktedonobacterales bacterium]
MEQRTTEQRHDTLPPPPEHAKGEPANGAHPAVSWRLAAVMAGFDTLVNRTRETVERAWESPFARDWRRRMSVWHASPYSGATALLAGTALITLLVAAINHVAVTLPNPGVIYLPLIAMLAYHWNWRHGAVASICQLICVYLLFTPPAFAIKHLGASQDEQLITLALVDAFILALVQLARARRDEAEREALRYAALNTIGTALSGELDEGRLLNLIAQTARDLTGAGFAAFTLRPVDALGRPLVPAEGNLFHLAAVVGVTPEQEALFRRVPLGGEGLLAPIFRHGVPVRVADALLLTHTTPPVGHKAALEEGGAGGEPLSPRDAARAQALAYAHGDVDVEALRGVGAPRGHPVVRSFLGAPLLDREGQVRGGLLLGHSQPGRFTPDDEILLQALATQAAVALENARLYRAAQTQARELDAVFESISDGVSVVNTDGVVLHENRSAATIRAALPEHNQDANALAAEVREPVARVLAGAPVISTSVVLPNANGEQREYEVSASPLVTEKAHTARGKAGTAGRNHSEGRAHDADGVETSGAVIVWHDVTETQKLFAERAARAQTEEQRTLLQMVVDEMPSGVYLVRGREGRLVLANQAAAEVWGAQWPVGASMAEFLAASGTQIVGLDGAPLLADELVTLRVLRTGDAERHYQEIVRRPDGTSLAILLNAVALDLRIVRGILLPGESGAARDMPWHVDDDSMALIVLQDMTALKEAERLKDEFIAIAAHELKTPMAAVKGYADMLVRQSERDAQSRLAAWQTEALETIDQATSRLVELTNDLLDVTRIQAGRLELHPEPHDLVALARRVVKRFRVTTDSHTLQIVVEGSTDFVVACLDVSRTEQVLGNLLSNAIKYSPDGGTITIGIREDVSRMLAELRVQDHGIGIPEKQQAQLFQRFSRADNARDLGIAGTGLGLYLCREVMELQGGRIWFTSAEGHGSTFYLSLPLATE